MDNSRPVTRPRDTRDGSTGQGQDPRLGSYRLGSYPLRVFQGRGPSNFGVLSWVRPNHSLVSGGFPTSVGAQRFDGSARKVVVSVTYVVTGDTKGTPDMRRL